MLTQDEEIWNKITISLFANVLLKILLVRGVRTQFCAVSQATSC